MATVREQVKVVLAAPRAGSVWATQANLALNFVLDNAGLFAAAEETARQLEELREAAEALVGAEHYEARIGAEDDLRAVLAKCPQAQREGG